MRRAAPIALGVALVLPALGGGFFGDDLMHIVELEGGSPIVRSPLDLYDFVPADRGAADRLRSSGALPWFSAPDLRIVFVRPLASALLWLDHTLFGRSPLGYHVHTLLWYAALLVVAAALLWRALPGSLGALALLAFCVDDAHALAASWNAARHASVSCVFVFLALVAHLRWRQDGWRAGAILAPVAACAGLAAGETALGGLAYIVAWELVERRPGRLRALAPTAAVVAAYLVAYRVTGSGAHGSGGYLDPFGDPAGFARALPGRVLLLAGNLVLGVPIDLVVADERLRAPMYAAGAAAIALVAGWLPGALRRMSADEGRAVRWLALGALGALVGGTPGFPGARVLLAAGVGGAAVLAALVRDAWRLLRAGRRRALAGAGLIAVGLPTFVAAPLALAGGVVMIGRAGRDGLRVAAGAEIDAPVPARVVVLALHDLVAIQLPVLRAFAIGVPADGLRALAAGPRPSLPDRLGVLGTTALSMSPAAHRLRRTAPDTFELSTPRATLVDGAWVTVLRDPQAPLPRGTRVSLPFMTATVLDDQGGRPTRVSFRFDRAVDDPSLVFLVRDRGRLRRFAMPALGAEVPVPQENPLRPSRE